jgi:light-regulated signal transduction histidine kinase (bacteriophytochrome)
LAGESISNLSTSNSFQADLQNELQKGFFDNSLVVPLKTKNFGFITCQISGFYLGLISDLSGYIILRIKPIDEIKHLNLQLEKSREELDEFIYRAAHDLRGPLATIRGLINLLKHHPTPGEMEDLLRMLDSHTETMDDRLSGLHYLSESGRSDGLTRDLNCFTLETTLRATLEVNLPVNSFEFHFNISNPVHKGIHEQHVISMLNNLLLYLLSLQQSKVNTLSYTLVELEKGLKVNIQANGFLADYPLMQAVRQKALLYSNAVTYSQLIHYYAAQKIARKIMATIEISFVNEGEQTISILVPKALN